MSVAWAEVWHYILNVLKSCSDEGLVWLQNFTGMLTSLFGSKTSRYHLGKTQFRFMKKTFSFVLQTIIFFIKESKRISNSHCELSFFRSVTLSFYSPFSVAVRQNSKCFSHSFQPWEAFPLEAIPLNENDCGDYNLSMM